MGEGGVYTALLGDILLTTQTVVLDKQAVQKLEAKVRKDRTTCGEKVRNLYYVICAKQGNYLKPPLHAMCVYMCGDMVISEHMEFPFCISVLATAHMWSIWN